MENFSMEPQPPATGMEQVTGVVKRYAPPNQRNRLNRRKSAERVDRNNSFGSEIEKNQAFASKSTSFIDSSDSGGSNILNENPRYRSRLIGLEGCSSSEAAQLMNDRWAAANHQANDPSIDLSERPIVYAKTTAWSPHFKLPHQIMSPTSSTVPEMDFLAELRRAKARAAAKSSSGASPVL